MTICRMSDSDCSSRIKHLTHLQPPVIDTQHTTNTTDTTESMPVLLEVDNLQTQLHLPQGSAHVVDHVSFTLSSSQTLALVGESGCGKTMTAYSILRLLPSPPAAITGGRILFNGENLLDLPEKKMRRIRGGKISIIFQEPLTSLNPVFRVGSQIAEVLQVHTGLSA